MKREIAKAMVLGKYPVHCCRGYYLLAANWVTKTLRVPAMVRTVPTLFEALAVEAKALGLAIEEAVYHHEAADPVFVEI